LEWSEIGLTGAQGDEKFGRFSCVTHSSSSA
jgi:hypothetical protein